MSSQFKNEVFTSYVPRPSKACGWCDKKPELFLSMLNSTNGRTVRMFKCECGEQTWTEDKA
jgi:hypothetical protein